jgi:phosphatidate cytidylyltransferase
MLRTRLWMGALLAALVVAVLLVDWAPWYPFLFVLLMVLSLAGCAELVRLLGPNQQPSSWLCYAAIVMLTFANWVAHVPGIWDPDPWFWVGSAFTVAVLAAWVVEMARFPEPGGSVTRIALTVWIVSYLGLLPSFFAQLRWLGPSGSSETGEAGAQSQENLGRSGRRFAGGGAGSGWH